MGLCRERGSELQNAKTLGREEADVRRRRDSNWRFDWLRDKAEMSEWPGGRLDLESYDERPRFDAVPEKQTQDDGEKRRSEVGRSRQDKFPNERVCV